MEELSIPVFETKKELFDFIVKNEGILIDQKKSQLKKADAVSFVSTIATSLKTNKSAAVSLLDKSELDALLIINTTNIMDSHKDVHIPGLWDKSLKENKRIKHLQEHKMAFDMVISDGDNLKAYTKSYNWKELGYDAAGRTEALVFESKILKSRNPYMHEQYAKGHVDNHSVGMRYVKLVTCINDEDYGAQFEAWEKYYPQVVNQAEAEKSGYFWAVTEAKCIEGSAVVNGSNFVTPTQSLKQENKEQSKYISAVKNWLG
jgi:hypothetical protein